MDALSNFTNRLSLALGLAPGSIGSILAAILVLVIGYFIAKAISGLVRKLIRESGLQTRVDRGARGRRVDVAGLIGKLVYYILMVLVLIIVLDILDFDRALAPLENLVGDFFSFLPRLIGAVILAFAGYVIATLLGELAGLTVRGIEGLGDRLGFTDRVDWGNVARQVVFFVVFIPILIGAIDVLGIEAISRPATRMLERILDYLPKIFGAAIVLAVFYYLAKFVSEFVGKLLAGVDADAFFRRVGLSRVAGRTSLSGLVRGLVFFFIMFSGVLTAVDVLDFDQLAVILYDVFDITLQILFGLLVLALGNAIATFAYEATAESQGSTFLASIARWAVLGLFLAIALRTMGLADDIVNLAFGLTLGALAVAFALSFGLGGREAAGRHMEDFLSKLRRESGSKSRLITGSSTSPSSSSSSSSSSTTGGGTSGGQLPPQMPPRTGDTPPVV